MLLASGRWQAAVATAIAALLIFYGFAGFPWPAFIGHHRRLSAYARRRLAHRGFRHRGLAFILVTGLWLPLMQSVYLTALAVLLCLRHRRCTRHVGRARRQRVSHILRPINDALQTMPQFVFLIPASCSSR